MIMRYELVAGGVLLLVVTLALKITWDLRTLPRLAHALNLLWAMLAAFHFWPAFHVWASGVSLAWDAFPLDAGSFWIAFLTAVLPGLVLSRWMLRDGQVEFPVFVDWLSGAVCTILVAWLVPCLLLMTISIIPAVAREAFPREGVAGECAAAMRGSPLRFYLRAAEVLGGERSEGLLDTRIPPELRHQVFPRRLAR